MTYLLKEPWTLRGFLNMPYMLIDPTGTHENPVRPMNTALWDTLIRCDGKMPLGETPALKALLNNGIVMPTTGGMGLAEHQRYHLHAFDWKHTVQFSITGRCNLNCRHCFMAADQGNTRPNDDMELDLLLDIVDQLAGCGVCNVRITGGEPLISPHFKPIVERITQRKMKVSFIATNGFFLDDKILDFLEEQGQRPQIAVSFDGIDTHNWMRNHPQAQERVAAAMETTVRRGFPLRATVQVNRHTAPRLTETCRFLKDKGAKSLFLIRTFETPRWAENTWVDESLPMSEYYDSAYLVLETALVENWGLEELYVFNGFTMLCDPKPHIVAKPTCKGHESCFAYCGRASASFFISHTGCIGLCDAFEGIGLAGGFFDGMSLKEHPLEELLSDSAYARAMEITYDDIRSTNEECGTCPHFSVCKGGCRAVGYGSSMFHEGGYAIGKGRLTNKAFSHCTYYRGGYDQRVRALMEQLEQ